jgi:hypothetical protein
VTRTGNNATKASALDQLRHKSQSSSRTGTLLLFRWTLTGDNVRSPRCTGTQKGNTGASQASAVVVFDDSESDDPEEDEGFDEGLEDDYDGDDGSGGDEEDDFIVEDDGHTAELPGQSLGRFAVRQLSG